MIETLIENTTKILFSSCWPTKFSIINMQVTSGIFLEKSRENYFSNDFQHNLSQ